jgi:hypothetical protein
LTKTLLPWEQPNINEGLSVRKKTILTAGFILMLFLIAIAEAFFVNFAQANPRASEASYFTIDAPEPFPAGTVAGASVGFVGVCLVIYSVEIQEEDRKIMRRTALVAWISCIEKSVKGGEA